MPTLASRQPVDEDLLELIGRFGVAAQKGQEAEIGAAALELLNAYGRLLHELDVARGLAVFACRLSVN